MLVAFEVAPMGGSASQSTVGRESTTERDLIQEWVVYIAGLFGLMGVGFGLYDILAAAVDADLINPPDDVEFGTIIGALDAAASFSLTSTPYVAIVLSVALGVFFGLVLTDDALAFKVAGATMAAGTAVCWLLAGIIASAVLDGVSLDFGGLLLNIVIAAAVAALVAVGSVWLTRNFAPADLSARSS